MSGSVQDSLVASSAVSKRWCAAGVADPHFVSSGISLIIFPMNQTMDRFNLPRNDQSMSILRYLWILPRVVVVLEIFIYYASISAKKTRDNIVINMQYFQIADMTEYSELFYFENIFHHTPFVFVSLLAHFLQIIGMFCL